MRLVVIIISLSSRAKEVRLKEDLSLAKFGAKVGEKKAKIYNIESNRQKMPGYILQRIVTIFDVNAHWLLTGEGEMYQSKSNNAELESTVSVTASVSLPEKLIHNHRKAKISAFIDYWFATKSRDEQIWFEVQLGHSFSQYADFLDNKEMEAKLRGERAE